MSLSRIESLIAFVIGGDVRTPLHYAASERRADMARMLLLNGADVNAKNSGGGSALHIASSSGDIEIVNLFISHGADIDALNDFKGTPLHLAASMGHIDVVRILIHAGANLHLKDTYNETAILFAACNNHLDIVALLIQHGCDVYARCQEQSSAWDIIRRLRSGSNCSTGSDKTLYSEENIQHIKKLSNWISRRSYLMLLEGTKSPFRSVSGVKDHVEKYLLHECIIKDVSAFLMHGNYSDNDYEDEDGREDDFMAASEFQTYGSYNEPINDFDDYYDDEDGLFV